MAGAIENAIKKNGGQVPSDIEAFRKSVHDEMAALKDFDVGGIVPPVDYSNHQGSTQARVSEIKGGKYVPQGEWIDAR
jgi:branched-chain amino acid transport system substrate-binding protein